MSTFLGIAIGLALGLTGSGGSIFAVPLLIYVIGINMSTAVPISLITVSLTSLFGLVLSAKSGLVAWRAGFVFAIGGMASAPLGTVLGGQLNDSIRLLSFAVLMLLIGLVMWRKAALQPDQASFVRADIQGNNNSPVCRLSASGELRFTAPCAVVLAIAGVAVGVMAGVFGVGGGFLIVPALIAVTQISAQAAVATSLLAITLISASGALSSLISDNLNLANHAQLITLFVLGSLLGMFLGRLIAKEIAGPTLQKVFAVMVTGTAIFMTFAVIALKI